MPTSREQAEIIRRGIAAARKDFLGYTSGQEQKIYELLQAAADHIAGRIAQSEREGRIPAARLRPLLATIEAEMAALRPKLRGQILTGMKNAVDQGLKAGLGAFSSEAAEGGRKIGIGTSYIGSDGKVRRYDSRAERYQDSRWGKINRNALEAMLKTPLTVSDRVWDLTWAAEKRMKDIVMQALIQGDSAATLSRKIRPALIQPKTLRGKAREAYHPGTGIYRSAFMNAMRLARTEYNRAFNEGLFRYAKEKQWIVGYVWHTGGSDPCDECDDLDGEYFEKGSEPEIPLHPNCMCFLELVTDESKNT